MITNTNLTDREIMDDILTSQKHITGVYNAFSNECVNQKLQGDMLKILNEEHSIQFSVFSDMQKKGWYNPGTAQTQMIEDTKTKFENLAKQL